MNFKQELYVFPSGLRLVFVKTPKFYTAKFKLVVETGSEDEQTPSGLAHLVEHSIFKGTTELNQEEISEAFNNLSADVDASTSSEFTVFKANFPKRNLEKVLRLYSSMLGDSVFDKREMEHEKQVIIEEILMHKDLPDQLVFDNLVKLMYSDCGIGNDIAGELDYFKKVKQEEVVSFHASHYHAKNFLVSVVGDFDFEEVKRLIKTYFDDKFNKKSKIKTKKWSKPSRVQPNVIFEKKDIAQSNILLGFKTLPYADFNRLKLALICFILGGSMSSRLFQKIRNELSLCYSVYAFDMNYKNNGFLGISLATSASNQKNAIDAVNAEIDRILHEGVTDEEFNSAKNLTLDKHLMNQDQPQASLSYLSYTGKLLNEPEMISYLKSITKEEALLEFKKYISTDREFISVVSPKSL